MKHLLPPHDRICAMLAQQRKCAARRMVTLQHTYIYLYAKGTNSFVGRRQQPPGMQLTHSGREHPVDCAHFSVSGEFQPFDVLCSPSGQVRHHAILRGRDVLHDVITCKGSAQRRTLWKSEAVSGP